MMKPHHTLPLLPKRPIAIPLVMRRLTRKFITLLSHSSNTTQKLVSLQPKTQLDQKDTMKKFKHLSDQILSMETMINTPLLPVKLLDLPKTPSEKKVMMRKFKISLDQILSTATTTPIDLLPVKSPDLLKSILKKNSLETQKELMFLTQLLTKQELTQTTLMESKSEELHSMLKINEQCKHLK